MLLELGRASGIVDLLWMVACGKAVDSIDAMRAETLADVLYTVLGRLQAAKVAADALQEEQSAAHKIARAAAAHIRLLTEVRSDFAGNACHGGAIDAGIAALADRIDSEIDYVHRALSKAEPEVARG